MLDDWCRAHKIQLTGHVDQEEVVNPVGLCGDLMKAFQHQAIPGVDEIGHYGRGSKAYRVVSSAANNGKEREETSAGKRAAASGPRRGSG